VTQTGVADLQIIFISVVNAQVSIV